MNSDDKIKKTEEIAHQLKGKAGLKRIINAYNYSLSGLKFAGEEQGFRQLCYIAIISIIMSFILPFEITVKMVIIFASVLTLIVELLNTGIEAAVDHTSLEIHPLAKRAKDVGSTAQMVALILLTIIWILALWQQYIS